MEVSANIIVSGFVQGVGFRYFTAQQARTIGDLRGFVRNLPDGTVEIDVEGERGLIETFIAAVKRGPRFSSVKDVKVEWKTYQGKYTSFDITYY